jgi:hypothetical protein
VALRLTVEGRSVNMLPFNTLLEIKVAIFPLCFVLNAELVTSSFTGFVLIVQAKCSVFLSHVARVHGSGFQVRAREVVLLITAA